MSEKTIQTSCPACQAVFDVPEDLIGQDAECPECDGAFVIEAYEAPNELPVDDGAPMVEGEVSSNTVKVSRSSIGMLPEIDDEATGLGLVKQRQRNTRTNLKIDIPKRDEKGDSDAPWWAFWKR